MQLTTRAIEEFQKIYEEEFGVQLTEIEADIKGVRLLTLFKEIYRPIKRSDMEKYGLLSR